MLTIASTNVFHGLLKTQAKSLCGNYSGRSKCKARGAQNRSLLLVNEDSSTTATQQIRVMDDSRIGSKLSFLGWRKSKPTSDGAKKGEFPPMKSEQGLVLGLVNRFLPPELVMLAILTGLPALGILVKEPTVDDEADLFVQQPLHAKHDAYHQSKLEIAQQDLPPQIHIPEEEDKDPTTAFKR